MGTFSLIRPIIDRAINLDLANPNMAISTKESIVKRRCYCIRLIGLL